MDDWLVSVVSDGKVVDLYFSDELEDIATIRALHKDCELEAMRLTEPAPVCVEQPAEPVKRVRIQSRRVRCVETGQTYISATACAEAIGLPRWNIYKAIQRGITAAGKHYEYI